MIIEEIRSSNGATARFVRHMIQGHQRTSPSSARPPRLARAEDRDPRGDARAQLKANIRSLVAGKLGQATAQFVESCLALADASDSVSIVAWSKRRDAAVGQDDKLAIGLWMLEFLETRNAG